MSSLNLKPVSRTPGDSSKPHPTVSLLKPWEFDYIPSSDGKDLNLLIMFHGLGDTKTSFTKLGKSLNLPSTAVLSLQAPDQIPLMDQPSFSWYNTFDPMFNPLPSPSPAKYIPHLRRLLSTLTDRQALGWALHDIHLFGYGQGGTVALELALDIGKTGLRRSAAHSGGGEGLSEGEGGEEMKRLGSVTSICAGLLSHPTTTLGLNTPILYFTRQDPKSAVAKKVKSILERAFREVEVAQGEGKGEDMPRGRGEWEGVMRFWGMRLAREEGWKGEGEVYEVVK